jgi:DNA polymerase
MKKNTKDDLLDLLFLVEDYIEYGYRRPTDERRRRLEQAPVSDAVRASRGRADGRLANSGRTDGGPAGVGRGGGDVPTPDDRTAEERSKELALLEERVRTCTKCPLHEGRTNAVPGTGVLDPLVMVIGEGPGAEEDRLGEPFVGKAGKYLDKWLEAIDLSRTTNAYIANIVKCRPPGNRDPDSEEAAACIPYLHEQIMLIRPKTILTVGRVATGHLLDTQAGIGSLRNTVYRYRDIPLIPTYHPSGVLRNPDYRRPVWEDLKLLRSVLDE